MIGKVNYEEGKEDNVEGIGGKSVEGQEGIEKVKVGDDGQQVIDQLKDEVEGLKGIRSRDKIKIKFFNEKVKKEE